MVGNGQSYKNGCLLLQAGKFEYKPDLPAQKILVDLNTMPFKAALFEVCSLAPSGRVLRSSAPK